MKFCGILFGEERRKYTDYTIKKSPYKKDIVKQVVDAYTAEGIDVFLYFSILEWNNSNYMGKAPSTPEEKAKFNKFLEYTRNQLLELLQNYSQIKGFWFDGTWDQSWICLLYTSPSPRD